MSCCQNECYEVSFSEGRNFFTRDEKVQMLKDYHQKLLNEAKGVQERISYIEKGKENNEDD